MLSKAYRVSARLHNSFNTSLKPLSRAIFSDYMALRVYTLPDGVSNPLFSVVTSKKVSKSAVLRNKMRRRIYAVIADILKNSEFSKKVYVFSITKNTLILKKEELATQIDFLLKKSKINQ